jgi:hypothetical protein
METPYFTLVHIAISLAGIASGFGALSGWFVGKLFPRWTAWFLATTVATSVTGFFFPFHGFTPAIGVGIVSLAILAVALFALYVRRLSGPWRKAFVICSVAALYLNFFVLVVQLFQKTPALIAIAPKQTEPPFALTQAVVLIVFIVFGIIAARRFRETK